MSVPIIQRKLQVMSTLRTKEETRIRKRKDKEGVYPQSGLPDSERPSEEGYRHSWESDDWYFSLYDDSSNSVTRGTPAWYGVRHTAWMTSVPLHLANHPTHVVLDLGCTRSIGSGATIKRFQKHALYYDLTTEFCRCNKSFVFANSETETCWESCIIHFPTTPPCSTKLKDRGVRLGGSFGDSALHELDWFTWGCGAALSFLLRRLQRWGLWCGSSGGIHYPPATDLAGGRSPNFVGDHCGTQAQRCTTPHSLDLFGVDLDRG